MLCTLEMRVRACVCVCLFSIGIVFFVVLLLRSTVFISKEQLDHNGKMNLQIMTPDL